jgi:hypothetical protein
MCISKAAVHQEKERKTEEMKTKLPPSAPELMMPQPPAHYQEWKKPFPPEDTPILTMPSSNSGSLRTLGVATTAHATSSSKKKKAAAQSQKGAHVKVTRSHLFHVLEHDAQREILRGYRNSWSCFGRTLSGSGKQGYNIQFDDLSTDCQDVAVK